MAFLPIAERELRVASRRKGTHRLRLWTTLAGLLVSCFFIFEQQVGGRLFGGSSLSLGQALFTILTFYTYVLALLAGVFLAADSISAEKREGTLGLLFLTDLRGYDVVAGKLVAVGLSALYGLVAVLPVTGLPVLMGGVTGGEFGRVALALVNTLFFALATGILVSTCSRESARAVGLTLMVLAIIAIGLPVMAGVLSVIHLPQGWWYFISFSPFNAFRFGLESRYMSAPGQYWYSLLTSHLVAWTMLGVASWILPRAWQDQQVGRRNAAWSGRSPVGAMRQGVRRAQLLDANPVAWLSEKPGASRLVWGITVAGAVVTASIMAIDHTLGFYIGASYVASLFILFLKVMVAFQACRFFAEARRNGSLEIIYSTPLTDEDIIKGQWLAVKRIFLWPVIVLLTAQLVMGFFTVGATAGSVNFKTAGSTAFASAPLTYFLGSKWPLMLISAGSILYKTFKSVCDILALVWLGMWFSLSLKKMSMAVGMTILLVLIVPIFAFCVPDVLIDLIFWVWARNKVREELRGRTVLQTLVPLGSPGFVVSGPPPVIQS